MASVNNSFSASSDADLAVRAAWMHYAGGYKQAEVAGLLGLSKLKAHRLITRANREGMIKVFVDGDVSECLALERQLTSTFGLDYCEVVPEFDPDPLPLKALGIAGGQYLRRLLEQDSNEVIGMGHGRTLGGFSEKFAANPHDVIHRLAERTGAQAFVMPVPFVANTIEDRDVFMSQQSIRRVIDMARSTHLKVIGIGAVSLDSSLVATGMVEESEIAAIETAGGAGELLGHFFSDDGSHVATRLTDRTMGLRLDDLRGSEIVAIAGGVCKTRAIHATLKSGLLNGLITDEQTAASLVNTEEIR